MSRYVVGNWKCHKNSDEAYRWLDTFAQGYRPADGLEVVLAPPFICLEKTSEYLQQLALKNVSLASQDISSFPLGGYTGAVAADMVKDLVGYVIVGHSERRRYFHETSHDVTNKVTEAADAGLTSIVCVDQSYAMSQLMALADIDDDKLIVAYSPVDALNFRIPEATDKVSESVNFIHEIHPRRTVIYGGSIRPENAAEYSMVSGLSGLFVGAASLDAKSFLKICNTVAEG